MTSRTSPPAEPNRAPKEDDVIVEHSALHRRLPNQHDLDIDDDQVLWTEGAARWADFDDMDEAFRPHGAPDDGGDPAAGDASHL